MHFLRRINAFFFAPRSATGFGLMRIAWAVSVLGSMLLEAPDIARYYSAEGFLPNALEPLVNRMQYRLTFFASVTDPSAVIGLYILLLLFCVFALIGVWPRFMTFMTLILYFSFHEKNPLPVGGGETVLHLIGFLLVISPGIEAFSLQRARKQLGHWKQKGIALPPLTMPAWPKRMVLWQTIVIYLASTWYKLGSSLWTRGTAAIIPLLHPDFGRFPSLTGDVPRRSTTFFTYATLVYEELWIFLLVPRRFLDRLPMLSQAIIRRSLLLAGVLFHVGIFVTMNVGSFSYAMLTLYCGLLEEEDFRWMRGLVNRRWRGRITVYYDGQCGFCTRSVFWLVMLDWLHRLRPVNFQNPVLRKKFASGLAYEDLDRSMHMRYPSGKTVHGFVAFRSLTWHLPLLWIAAPFLYLPGVAFIGDRIYKWKARTRKKCSHEGCTI